MIRLFGQSLAIFASNAPALLGITLLIYLPINVGLNLLIDESQLDDFDFTALQAYTLAELLFGTLASGFATVVAARARLGEPVRFAAAFTQSLRRWTALIGATVLFNIGFGFGLLLLVVPGVYLALRWALIYPAIVLDDAGVNHSFSRSTWLTEGVRWQILGCGLLGIVVISVLTGVLYLPLEWLPESLYFPTVVVVDTLLSWAALLWPILLTLFYLEARAADEQTDLPHDPYYPTDGDRAVVESEDNPYRSPQY